MKNTRWIICFDFETDSPDPETCNPTELAAVPIDPDSLEIKKDQAFQINIRPEGIDEDSYWTKERQSTLKWTAETRGMSTEEVVSMWKSGVAIKLAMKQFHAYCKKYNVAKKKGQWFPEPIPAGYNITGFDLKILARCMKKAKLSSPLSTVNRLDAMDNLFWWFENLHEPVNFRMNTWREFFELEAHGDAHEALSDVIDEAKIITRFLKFHRRQASVKKFKGAFCGQ